MNKNKRFIWVLMCALFAFSLLWLACEVKDGDTQKKVEAKVMCEKFIKDRLKSPTSAKFSEGIENIEYLGEKKYKYKGTVDAKNSFNASLRKNFICVVKDEGNDKWSLIGLNF